MASRAAAAMAAAISSKLNDRAIIRMGEACTNERSIVGRRARRVIRSRRRKRSEFTTSCAQERDEIGAKRPYGRCALGRPDRTVGPSHSLLGAAAALTITRIG